MCMGAQSHVKKYLWNKWACLLVINFKSNTQNDFNCIGHWNYDNKMNDRFSWPQFINSIK